MLSNLRTIHKPATLEEASELLRRPGVYPLYGGGAALIRQNTPDVVEAVDLTGLIAAGCSGDKNGLRIDGCATLETLATYDSGHIGPIIREDTPETLRNALTVGDVLMECRPDSLTLAVLVGLKAQIRSLTDQSIDFDHWFSLSADERRQIIVTGVFLPEYRPGLWQIALEKVSRTPADAPIVASIGFAHGGGRSTTVVTFFFVVCGLSDHPVRCKPKDIVTLQSQIDDYRGSAEYRTEMAKLVSNRAIMKAVEAAQKVAQQD
jgi:CO/xanthine dehydrogenase FAD-binding subunit